MVEAPNRFLEPAALDPLDHEPVHAGVDGLLGRGEGAHHMKHGDPRVVEAIRERSGVAGRRGHEPNVFGDKETHGGRIAIHDQRDVRAHRTVGEPPHTSQVRSPLLGGVSMMPSAPALDTAAASLAPAM
jgi:hypothetical protein